MIRMPRSHSRPSLWWIPERARRRSVNVLTSSNLKAEYNYNDGSRQGQRGLLCPDVQVHPSRFFSDSVSRSPGSFRWPNARKTQRHRNQGYPIVACSGPVRSNHRITRIWYHCCGESDVKWISFCRVIQGNELGPERHWRVSAPEFMLWARRMIGWRALLIE